jgi:hypothetical protein
MFNSQPTGHGDVFPKSSLGGPLIISHICDVDNVTGIFQGCATTIPIWKPFTAGFQISVEAQSKSL